jgi:hypothetical protein
MAEVLYYHGGRGMLRLSGPSAAQLRDGLSTATQLVGREALLQHHQGARWQVSASGVATRCPQCGNSAVISRLSGCLVVDSYLHAPCRPYDSEDAAGAGEEVPELASAA